MADPSVISIDPRGARELDDAISVERRNRGWTVHVLLPDVPGAMPPGGDEDAAAREAGMTRYSGDAVRHPMLARETVEALSLSPDRDGPGILIEIAVAADLQATVAGVERRSMRTAARLTYEGADSGISDPGHPHHPALATMWDLARRLHADRAAGTGARFDIENRLLTNEEGHVIRMEERNSHRSNMAVMEIMILANAALARMAAAKGAPVLYRNHHLLDMERGDRASAAREIALREGIGRREAAARLPAMSHLIGQAELGTEPKGHFGLDLASYAWFTSPLRRYCDVVNLRALVDGAVDHDLDGLASRLTGMHRQQKDMSSEHHGATSRRRVAMLVDGSRHDKLDGIDLHVIIRALDENPGFDRTAALRHIGRRMAADGLAGRDIDALESRAEALLGADAARTVVQWIDAEPARRLLLDEHRGATVRSAAAEPDSQAKSTLHEAAQRHRARIVFEPPVRIGPAHAPVFVSTARWIGPTGSLEAQGRGRTKKTAEIEASTALLAMIPEAPAERPAASLTRPAVAAPATTTAAAGKAPKTELLEIAVARRATVAFGEAVRDGADHLATFTVEAVWSGAEGEVRRTGTGRTRKDAEREASSGIIEALRRPRAARVPS